MKTIDEIQADAIRVHEMKGELKLSIATKARIEAASAERAAVVRFLRAEAVRLGREADAHDDECAAARVASAVAPHLRSEAAGLLAAAESVQRGDHLNGEMT